MRCLEKFCSGPPRCTERFPGKTYHFSVRIGPTLVRIGPTLDPDFPNLELKTFPHMCGTYSADKYCGSWPRQPIPARPAFSIGFPPQTPPGWPGPTREYRMGILVPFSRVLPYSAGTRSPVSSPRHQYLYGWDRYGDVSAIGDASKTKHIF